MNKTPSNPDDLSFGKKVGNYWRNEGAKLKEMTFKEKILYIVDYYKMYFISIVLIAAFIASLVISINSNNYNEYLSVYFINNPVDEEYTSYIVDDFGSLYNVDGDKNRIIVNTTISADLGSYSEFDMQSIYKLMALLSAQSIDIMISDTAIIDSYSQSETYYDLSVLLPADLYAQVEDRLYYGTTEDGTTYPVGINLEGLEITEECMLYIEPAILTVASNAPNQEHVIDFINYIFGN